MSQPLIISRIGEIEASLRVIRDTEGISKTSYVTLHDGLNKLRLDYLKLHGEEVRSWNAANSRDKQLPLLSTAAATLLTLRTALPVGSEANILQAEQAIANAIEAVAEELKRLINPQNIA